MVTNSNYSSLSPFAAKIYTTLQAHVPAGTVITYGALAKLAGYPQAARAVGNVLHRNPFAPEVPCHRVVNARGELAKNFGVVGGRDTQRRLLEAEGVRVIEGERLRVDLV